MKILFLIYFSLNASILKEKNITRARPESKKTLLDFDNKTQTINLYSPNILNKVTTKDKKSSNIKTINEEPGLVKLDTKSHLYQDFEKGGDHLNLDTEKNSIPNKEEGITEEQKVFSDLLGELTDGTHTVHGKTKVNCHDPKQHCSKKQKLNLAQSNIEQIQKELNKALLSTKGKKPVVVDGNLLQTMISYFNHLDYVNQIENDYLSNPVPKMPKPLIIKHVIDEKDPDEAIDEKMEEKKKELQEQLNLLKAKMEDIKDDSDEGEEQLLKIEEQKTQIMKEIEDIDNQTFTGDQKKQIINQIQKEYLIEQDKESLGQEKAAKDLQNEITALEDQAFKLEQQKKVEDDLVQLDEEENNLKKQKEDLINDEEKEHIDNYQLLDKVNDQIEHINEQQEKLEQKDEELTQKIEEDDENQNITNNSQQSSEEQSEQNQQEKLSNQEQIQSENDQIKPQQQTETDEQNQVDNQDDVKQEENQNNYEPQEEDQIDHNLYYVEGEYKISDLGKSSGAQIKFDEYGNPKDYKFTEYLSDNIKDVPKIRSVIDKFTNGYIELFNELIFTQDDIPKDFELNRKKTLKIFNNTYRFIYMLIDNKGDFYKDIRFLLEKLYNFEPTKNRIAEFYNQEDTYDDILEQVDKKSPDFVKADQQFKVLTKKMTDLKNNYQKNIQKVYKLFELVLKETEFLQRLFLQKEHILYENKIQVVEQLYPKLLNIKQEGLNILSSLKNSMDNFSIYKIELQKILEQMDIAAMKQGDVYKELNDILNQAYNLNIFSIIFLLYTFFS